MSDDYADYSASKLKEWLEGRYGEVDEPVSKEAGMIDAPETQALIRELRNAWTNDWGRFEDSEVYRRLAGAGMDETIQRAVAHGHKPTMDRVMGRVEDKPDLSGYRTIEQLEQLIRDMPVFQMYLYSGKKPPTGAGKTDFALFLSEIFERVYPDAKFGSNIQSTDSWAFTTTQYSEMLEWLNDTDGKKLFIIDEASQDFGSNSKEGKALSKLLKLFRKKNANLIIIGHTGRDIARDVRRQVLVCNKHSEKTATVGYGLTEEDEEIHIANEIQPIKGIPATNREYWSGEETTWDMDMDVDDNEDEEAPQCKAVTKASGTRCTQDATHGAYCYNHRGWEGETVDDKGDD